MADLGILVPQNLRNQKRIVLEVTIEEGPASAVWQGIAYAGQISHADLLKRYIAKGLSFDMQKPAAEGEAFAREFVTVTKK